MPRHRRTLLQAAGTAGLASLAGCSALSDLLSGSGHEYSLTVEPVGRSIVEHGLFDPDEDAQYGAAARDALDEILPDGRHTTFGFEPLPADAYVEHDGRYFQTKTTVTGRERMERTLVRATRVDPEAASGERRTVDSLPEASARVVHALHEYHVGGGSSTDRLRGDAYVLRRPAELDGPIADELDGALVTMDEAAGWAYRLVLSSEPIVERVYETFAVAVAPDRAAFREVVLATRVDAEIDRTDLDPEVRRLLHVAIRNDVHRETTPLSDRFRRLIERLGLGHVGVSEDGRILWYDDSLFRYGLYVSPVS